MKNWLLMWEFFQSKIDPVCITGQRGVYSLQEVWLAVYVPLGPEMSFSQLFHSKVRLGVWEGAEAYESVVVVNMEVEY